MPISNILRLEADENAECCLGKLKDSVWLDEKESFERVRIYLEVLEREISGLRLVMPEKSTKFFRNVSSITGLTQEKTFMRPDLENYTPIEVKGSSVDYTEDQTEVVLLFPQSLGEGNYVLAFDLHTDGYENSDILTFLLLGLRWKYESKNYFSLIKDRDMDFVVECRRIEMWIIPPYPRKYWRINPDVSVLRCAEMSKQAVAILEKSYEVPNPGPPGRPVFQWEQKGGFGKNAPFMISKVECHSAINPLLLILSIGGFIGFVISVALLLFG